MGNDPVNNIDPSGGRGESIVSAVAVTSNVSGGYNAVVTFSRVASHAVTGLNVFSAVNTVANSAVRQIKGGKIINSAFKSKTTVPQFKIPVAAKAGGLLVTFLLSPLKAGFTPPTSTILGYYISGELCLANIYKYEILTDDPTTLSDDYLNGVAERIMQGKGTPNDHKYAPEILRRKAGRFINELLESFLAPKVPVNGETNATKLGRQAHDEYDPGSDYETDRGRNTLENGKIPDAIDKTNKIVRELKPNNKRKIREGKNQVNKYAKQLEIEFGGKWKTVVDTYDINPDGTFTYHFGIPK